MNIGIFTDTYFPQVSGVATSIKTLRDELIREGHHVYIFTTTDPHADTKEDRSRGIYRFPSIPFVGFTERRLAVAGYIKVLRIARKLDLDIVHNQTEFFLGLMGKEVARELHIPCVHTYHTMYQDYLHYVANGKILKPSDVKKAVRVYMKHIDGIIAPSDRVLQTMADYGVDRPIRVIPTGVDLTKYQKPASSSDRNQLRKSLGYGPDTPLILSLSRLAYEKNIAEIIEAMPDIIAQCAEAQLLVVGDGPAKETLERQVREMNLGDHVQFIGQVDHDQVYRYYHIADVMVSASDSETQGLTYDEAVAADLPIVVMRSEYTDSLIDDPAIGFSFQKRADLVAGVLHYLTVNSSPEDHAKRQKKLHNISAPVFVHRVLQFYRDCIQRKAAAEKNKRRGLLQFFSHQRD